MNEYSTTTTTNVLYKAKAQRYWTIQCMGFRKSGWGQGIVGGPSTKYLT